MGSGRRCGFAAILRRELIFPFAVCQANDFPLDHGKMRQWSGNEFSIQR